MSYTEATGLDLVGDIPHWSAHALCPQTDPEAFFPQKGESTKEAKRICGQCDVKTECLEDALATNDWFGIRGGLTEAERRKIKRRPGGVTAADTEQQA